MNVKGTPYYLVVSFWYSCDSPNQFISRTEGAFSHKHRAVKAAEDFSGFNKHNALFRGADVFELAQEESNEVNESNIEDIRLLGVDYSKGKDITVATIRLDILLPWQREQILNQIFQEEKGGVTWPPNQKQPIS